MSLLDKVIFKLSASYLLQMYTCRFYVIHESYSQLLNITMLLTSYKEHFSNFNFRSLATFNRRQRINLN